MSAIRAKNTTGLLEVGNGAYAAINSFLGKGGGPHCGFIVSGDQLLIIDSLMFPSQVREFQAQIRSVTSRKPTFVINSHHHRDHVSGNQFFSPPAQIIAHSYVREWMLGNGEQVIERMRREASAERAREVKRLRVTPPTITYHDRMSLHLDGMVVELIHLGKAHTFGDTVVYLPQEKVIYAADVIVTGTLPYVADGHSASWIEVLDAIEGLGVETVVPGHGYLGDPADIAELREYLTELRRLVKQFFDAGVSEEQAMKELRIDLHKEWAEQDSLPSAIKRIYQEMRGELD